MKGAMTGSEITSNNKKNDANKINGAKMTTANRLLGVIACGASLFAGACGGGGGSTPTTTTTTTTTPTGSNVQAIIVNAGPSGNYANGAFTNVTVCVPGTSTCQTIDSVLVDTGSSGLRLLASVLTIPLPPQTSGANAVYECLPFVIGYTWGPVQTADIEMADEKASSVPIQVISGSPPSSSPCTPAGQNSDTVSSLGANGIVGVGTFPQDCGEGCATTGPSNPDLYYECPSPGSGCTVMAESLAQQVQNPVALFATDNNGVIIELPAVTAPEATLSGSLVFGIGTQSNNGLNGATVYPMAPTGPNTGDFTTTFNGAVYDQSFIDSGSNGYFFPDSSIPVCSGGDFYCPSSTENLSAINAGYAGTPTGKVNFSVANADDLFNDNPSASVFSQLAGPSTIGSFDWGLPFFYGRNVYTAIYGATTPGGTGPYWAY
jgi:Protein of unknown function (DUF3443)